MRPQESFVEQPIRSLQTMLEVIARDDQTLPDLIPDGIYGQSTRAAVTQFQKKYSLPITGIVDLQTWEMIVAVYDDAIIQVEKAEPIEVLIPPGKIYRYGERSPNIYLLQSLLIQLSFLHSQIPAPEHTGVLDGPTASSLKVFQGLSGLPETGELDRITWKNLAKQYALYSHHIQAGNDSII